MEISAANSSLKQIPVDKIERNAENPRLLFRQGEMDQLLESIRTYGVQVPISVYQEKNRYVLLDGERRWRCAIKLNLKTIPALVQEPPDRLENILLMFNIHAMREQWDLLSMALKLRDVISLLRHQTGRQPTEPELAKRTGLSQGVIRRCRLLLGLPETYKKIILSELEKPKNLQKFSEDFFIEMERSLKTVERAMPDIVDRKDRVRRVLIKKFEKDVIPNRVHFRLMARIAGGPRLGSSRAAARRSLTKLFEDNDYSIQQAYEDSASDKYVEHDLETRVESLVQRLGALRSSAIAAGLRTKLRQLMQVLEDLLKS
jgi:ParB family transcriptional regulator, chromosome partitioning protein